VGWVEEKQTGQTGGTTSLRPGQGRGREEPRQRDKEGKVPCSRCGQPSDRGLCEACLDAITELRQLSSQFEM